MLRVGDNILNHGSSFGLQYPLIYGFVDNDWIIWNRHTGEVVYVEEDKHPQIAPGKCSKKCEELNGIGPMDEAMKDALDSTP